MVIKVMNKFNDDPDKVTEDKIQGIKEVRKMSATSTTSNNEGEQISSDLKGETSMKKRKLFLSKEKKEMAEKSRRNLSTEIKEAFDAVKTNNRISQELPKCNWLEDKIKEIELSKRAEECQRLIEEELSKRKSISGRGENSPDSEHSSINPSIETAQDKIGIEKTREEIQDDLMQQKQVLLKDIRIIQKRKIKEMEELIEIKLKKENYEQELDNTRIDIKKMDEHFENMRKRKTDQNEESFKIARMANSTDDTGEEQDTDIKIIDVKTKAKTGVKHKMNVEEDQCKRTDTSNRSETISILDIIPDEQDSGDDKPLNLVSNQSKNGNGTIVPPTIPRYLQKPNGNLKIRNTVFENSIDIKNKEKIETYQKLSELMPHLSKTSDSNRNGPLPMEQTKSKTVGSNLIPSAENSSLQHRNYHEAKVNSEPMQRSTPSVERIHQIASPNEAPRGSPITENNPRSRTREDWNELSRSPEDPNQLYSHRFHPYKPQRKPDAFYPHPPQLQQVREYKDAILIPVTKQATMNNTMLPSQEKYIRELHENSYEKQQYHRAMQLQSPPAYQTLNSFISKHEAMFNQRYQENMHIPLRPIPQRSASFTRVDLPNQNPADFPPFSEQQSAHFRHLSMQNRHEIERYIPQIAQEMKRHPHASNIQILKMKAKLPDEKCEACGKDANFTCSACRGAHYCSAECQRERWAAHCNNCVKIL